MTHKKKKRTKKRKHKSSLVKNRLFFIATFLTLLFLGFGYYNFILPNNGKQKIKKVSIENQKSTKDLMRKMKKMLEAEKQRISKELKTEQKVAKEQNTTKQLNKKIAVKKKLKKHNEKNIMKSNYLSEIADYKKSLKFSKVKKKKRKAILSYKGLPRLAIIIDDVSFVNQVKMMLKIPYIINPSFFPPTSRHPNTVKLSKKFKFTMVHIPLEALGYPNPEPDTLLVSDSYKTIQNRIKQIKKEFPSVKYYNNHTGSKFTSNLSAMKKLLKIMKNQRIHFIDSRTTADTKAGIVSKELHIRLLSRDVFLDNSIKKSDIITQLKRAVKIAKKTGYAIAIGHPHTNTLDVLIHSKPYLKGVRLVYVNQL